MCSTFFHPLWFFWLTGLLWQLHNRQIIEQIRNKRQDFWNFAIFLKAYILCAVTEARLWESQSVHDICNPLGWFTFALSPLWMWKGLETCKNLLFFVLFHFVFCFADIIKCLAVNRFDGSWSDLEWRVNKGVVYNKRDCLVVGVSLSCVFPFFSPPLIYCSLTVIHSSSLPHL